MLTKAQREKRLERLKLANELLIWVIETSQWNGCHAYERVIRPFAAQTKTSGFEVWRAWDMLLTTHRRAARPGSAFSIINLEPIKEDEVIP